MKITKSMVMEKLKKVPDPELGISIVDLGLIYDVAIDKTGDVTVHMTLTTMGCPLFDMIATPIRNEVGSIKGAGDVIVELTFDPPWSVERMSEEARTQLGFF